MIQFQFHKISLVPSSIFFCKEHRSVKIHFIPTRLSHACILSPTPFLSSLI